jgi:hypothetical protein
VKSTTYGSPHATSLPSCPLSVFGPNTIPSTLFLNRGVPVKLRKQTTILQLNRIKKDLKNVIADKLIVTEIADHINQKL